MLHYYIKLKLIYSQRTIHPSLMENINNLSENALKDQVSSLINHNLDLMQWGWQLKNNNRGNQKSVNICAEQQ